MMTFIEQSKMETLRQTGVFCTSGMQSSEDWRVEHADYTSKRYIKLLNTFIWFLQNVWSC